MAIGRLVLALLPLLQSWQFAAANKCPQYADVANVRSPAVANFSIDRYLGRWFEIRSHNVPVLTTGCTCTRYNCACGRKHSRLHVAVSGHIARNINTCDLVPRVDCCRTDTNAAAGEDYGWEEHLACCRGTAAGKRVNFVSKGRPTAGVKWPGEMQAAVAGMPYAAYWVLDVIEKPGRPDEPYAVRKSLATERQEVFPHNGCAPPTVVRRRVQCMHRAHDWSQLMRCATTCWWRVVV